MVLNSCLCSHRGRLNWPRPNCPARSESRGTAQAPGPEAEPGQAPCRGWVGNCSLDLGGAHMAAL